MSLFKKILRYIFPTIIIVFFCFELWVIIENKLTDNRVPENLGNFTKNIHKLRKINSGDKFRFAVIGDSRSEGTMEEIARKLRGGKIDFGVLIGDIAFSGNEDEHRWLRNEINNEWNIDCPLFYLIGNHDIDYENYPISRFEKDYGKNIFSFQYGNCLFIFLRVWNSRGLDYEESLNFLRKLSEKDLGKYRKRFVFMHQPPPIPTLSPVTEFTNTDEFNKLFKKLKIDYVFASDFHGYAWTEYQGTIYNITGGAGAKLVKTSPPQFHHALIFEVGENYVSKQFVVVDKSVDIEDHFKRIAFIVIWPFFRKHLYLALGLNILMLAVLGTIINKSIEVKHGVSNQPLSVFFKYLISLTLLLLLVMIFQLISYYDYEWTTFLRQNRNDFFRHLVENTILKGQPPGLRDLVSLILILSGCLYLFSFIKNKFTKLKYLRPVFSLILISGLACLLFTHSIKNGMSRPRPKDVYNQKVEFSSWYEFGPDIIPHSTYRASMPSGHTAMVAVLISLAYAMFLSSKKKIYKITGIVLLIFTLVLTLVMGISRAMSAHWISDTLISLFGCWLIIHIIYNYIRSREISGEWKEYFFSDLQFCLRLTLFFVGVFFILIGIHSMQIKLGWNSLCMLLVFPGIVFLLTSVFKDNLSFPLITFKRN